MKIDCAVTGVEDHGDTMLVILQGSPPKAAAHWPQAKQEIRIPVYNHARRAFYIGRKVVLTIEPK